MLTFRVGLRNRKRVHESVRDMLTSYIQSTPVRYYEEPSQRQALHPAQ